VLAGGCAESLRAQQVAVDAGVIRVTTDSTATVSGASLAPVVRFASGGLSVTGAGSYAAFGQGEWSADGSLAGTYLMRGSGGFRPEVGAVLAGTTSAFGNGTSLFGGSARIHRLLAAGGFWVGGGIERASSGIASRTVSTVDLGAWKLAGPATLALRATPSWITTGIRYTDVTASASLDAGTIRVQAVGSARAWGSPGGGSADAAFAASAAIPVGRTTSIVLGGGSYLADATQGLPAGRYLTLGLRFGLDAGRLARPPATSLSLAGAKLPRVGASGELRTDGETGTLMIRAPDAASVEVEGDFTDWRPIRLTPDGGGRWIATFRLAPGIHRFNVRVDGGPWGAPAGVAAEADEFGSVTAVWVVE
jgi:hypothetical protein